MESKELLQKIRTEILKFDPGAEIYLFGSRARGDFRNDSDWDLLIVTPKEKITFDYEMKLRDPIFNLEMSTGEVISLVVYTKEDWQAKKNVSPLLSNVLKEGVRI